MNITLNPRSIFDEIFALSAMAALHRTDTERPPLLCRDQIPGLRHLVRMAFANLVMQFAERISACRFDETTPGGDAPYDPDYPLTMEIELNAAAGSQTPADDAGRALLIKANMEHVVALTTLSFVFDCVNPDLARSYRLQAAEASTSLGEDIDPAIPPGRLAAWYY